MSSTPTSHACGRLAGLACSLVLLTGLPARAQDLLSAYRFAADDDRRLAASAAQVQASRARHQESLAASRPQVLARLGTSWSHESYRDPQQTDRYNANGYGVVLTQSLLDRASDVQQDQAAIGTEYTELRRLIAAQELRLRVAKSYIGVLQAQARERALDVQLAASEAQRDRVQRMAQAGSATQPDVEEAQARVDLARAQCLAAKSDRELQLASLRQAAGATFSPNTELRPDAVLQPPQPESIEQWVDAARQDNLELRAALLASRLAAREIDKQRAAGLPTVQLFGLHGRLSQHGGIIFGMPVPSNRVTQTTIGLQLTLPLATGGAIDARTQQAVANRQYSEDMAEEARRQAALSARQAFTSVSTGLERVHAEQRAMASAQATLRSTQAAFEVGKRLSSDVLNAQQQLASAEQRWQQARYDTLLAQLQLKATVGALDEAELARVSSVLSPVGTP